MANKKFSQTALRLTAVFAGGFLFFRFLGPVLLPFAVGLLPAKAANRAVDRLHRSGRMPRWLAAGLCVGFLYILFFLAVFFLGKLLFGELEHFFDSLPALAGALTEPVHRLEQTMLRLASRFPDGIGAAMEQWTKNFFRSGAGLGDKLYEKVFRAASILLKKAPDLALFSLTALLSGIMLSCELPKLQSLWEKKAPKAWQQQWEKILEKLKGTLFCWLKAQGKLMGITSLVLTAGFLILRINSPFLLGLVISIVDALPVLGSGLVLIPWAMVCFLAGDNFLGVGLLCVYGASALIRTAMEPRLLGKQMGLDPLLTLLSLYTGYRFFGIWGMVLFPMGVMFVKQILN